VLKKVNIFPYLLFIFIVGYAIVVGFRMPSLWSINYYLPSFFDGFYRRALPGTILTILGNYKYNYYLIASIQFSILFSLLIWIFLVFKKNSLTMFIITSYFVSACGGFLFHEIGYVDQLLYLILFISITIYNKHRVASIVLFSSSMFMHELSLFVTVPLYFTFIYMQTNRLKKAFIDTLPSLIFFIIIYFLFQTVPLEKIVTFTNQIKEYANYSYRYDYYGIFVSEFVGNQTKIHYHLNCIIPLLLLFIMSVVIGVVSYQVKKNILTSFLITSSGLAPLLLGIFAYDLNRWFFLSFSSLTIIFIIFILHYNISFHNLISQKWGAILVICYILFSGNMIIDYFEGLKPRSVNVASILEVKKEIGNIPKL